MSSISQTSNTLKRKSHPDSPSPDEPAKRKRSRHPKEDSKENKQDSPHDKTTDNNGVIQSLDAAVSPVLNNSPNYEIDDNSEWAKQHAVDGLPGATLFYQSDFINEETANRWYRELCELETWYRPTLQMYGKPYIQSRSIAAYVTSPELTARYSGHSVKMNSPYAPLLVEIQNKVQDVLGVGFDHVMLNWYQDGNVHIGKHRDTKENQVIASLSLGAQRTFIMHPHLSKGEKKVASAEQKRWILANGSLLAMQGDTQENWKHEIPKEPKVKEGRISLTFRQIVHDSR